MANAGCEMVTDLDDPVYVVCKHCGSRFHSMSFYSPSTICRRRLEGWGPRDDELRKLITDWRERAQGIAAFVQHERPVHLGAEKGLIASRARGEMLAECARLLLFCLEKTNA